MSSKEQKLFWFVKQAMANQPTDYSVKLWIESNDYTVEELLITYTLICCNKFDQKFYNNKLKQFNSFDILDYGSRHLFQNPQVFDLPTPENLEEESTMVFRSRL
ncbi:MAG TPA: hypothetical protein PK657_02735 [Legionella sp.]|nr:hypothetical protein [Legionella sp.]